MPADAVAQCRDSLGRLKVEHVVGHLELGAIAETTPHLERGPANQRQGTADGVVLVVFTDGVWGDCPGQRPVEVARSSGEVSRLRASAAACSRRAASAAEVCIGSKPVASWSAMRPITRSGRSSRFCSATS
jgi:hypothetical protein